MLALRVESPCLNGKPEPDHDSGPSVAHLVARAPPLAPPAISNNVLVGVVRQDPALSTAGMFANDPFADDVDIYIAEERQRQRDEAAREAGEDAL